MEPTPFVALVVDVANGRELGVGVVDYPGGKQGVLTDPGDHHWRDNIRGLPFRPGAFRP